MFFNSCCFTPLFSPIFKELVFFFSVHEKSILLPLVAATLLSTKEPILAEWFTGMALFSMFPLLEKDKLVVAYFALFISHLLFNNIPTALLPPQIQQENKTKEETRPNLWEILAKRFMWTSFVGCGLLHLFRFTTKPPEHLLYLHDLLMVTYAFIHFFGFYLYSYWKQLSLGSSNSEHVKID